MGWIQTETKVARVALDPAVGNIRRLEFCVDGQRLSPLHTAPWADDPEMRRNEKILPVEARLAGDFFCAPFGADDLDNGPAHGWTANSRWALSGSAEGMLEFQLERPIKGAQVTKQIKCAPDATLLYQAHVILGGHGCMTFAHHPMFRLQGRGTFSTSPKSAAITPDQPLEAGRNRLASGQRATDLSRLAAADGGFVDLQSLPIADRHEDFVTLIEAGGAPMGWSAVVREVEDDIVFVLKDPAVLPVTMLWHSNGGRDYAPWNGAHRGVLGIEDGCAAGAAGFRAALGNNRVSAEGVETCKALGHTIRIAHVIGALPRPKGWRQVQSIAARDGALTLTDVGGGTYVLPFDTDFFSKGP